MLDNSKSLKQEEGISIWKDNNFHGTLNYVPRFGKTRIIDLVCSRTRLKPCNIDKKILIIVPTEIAYLNVVKIIKDNKCDYCTRNSLANYINNNSLDGPEHIGIVTENNNGIISLLEGNTGNKDFNKSYVAVYTYSVDNNSLDCIIDMSDFFTDEPIQNTEKPVIKTSEAQLREVFKKIKELLLSIEI